MSNGDKFFNWSSLLIGLVGALAGVAGFAYAVQSGWIPLVFDKDTKFFCQLEPDTISGGQVWTVMYRTKDENPKPWLKMVTTLGGDYTPQKRCELISERLDGFRQDGLRMLAYQKDETTGQYVICAQTQLSGENGCPLLITLKPGADPYLTLREMTESLRSGNGVYQSSDGSSSDSFSPESPIINLHNYLAKDDLEQ